MLSKFWCGSGHSKYARHWGCGFANVREHDYTELVIQALGQLVVSGDPNVRLYGDKDTTRFDGEFGKFCSCARTGAPLPRNGCISYNKFLIAARQDAESFIQSNGVAIQVHLDSRSPLNDGVLVLYLKGHDTSKTCAEVLLDNVSQATGLKKINVYGLPSASFRSVGFIERAKHGNDTSFLILECGNVRNIGDTLFLAKKNSVELIAKGIWETKLSLCG